MFAPWCPTCSARMLLGTRRVEAVEPGPHGPRVILRCFCGTALVWSAEAERPIDVAPVAGSDAVSPAPVLHALDRSA